MSEQPSTDQKPMEWTDIDYHAMPAVLKPHLDKLLKQNGVVAPPPLSEPEDNPPLVHIDDDDTGFQDFDSGYDDMWDDEDPVDLDVGNSDAQWQIDSFRIDVAFKLAHGDIKPDELLSLAAEMKQKKDDADMASEIENITSLQNYDFDLGILAKADPEVLKEAYTRAKDDHSPLYSMLDNTLFEEEKPIGAATFLARAYGLRNAAEFQSKRGPHRKDDFVKAIMDFDNYTEIALESLERDLPDEPTARRDMLNGALQTVLGFSPELAKEIEWATYTRINNLESMDPSWRPSQRQHDILQTIAEHSSKLTKDGMESLHQDAGITNFEYYDTHQLDRMLRFINRDPDLLDQLQAGDVTVVFSTAKGDHNAAMSINATQFENPNQRTLYFEVAKPDDFKHFSNLMLYRGIRPSTVVLAAHGFPGYMDFFGPDDNGFLMTNQIEPDKSTSSFVAVEKVMNLYADRYMQPSRGIDDDESAAGRMRVVLKSCSQDKPGESWPLTTAESMTYSIDNPDVDVYAGSEVTAWYQTANGNGVRMEISLNDGTNGWQGLEFSRLRLARPDKRLVKTKVPEVPLWKNHAA